MNFGRFFEYPFFAFVFQGKMKVLYFLGVSACFVVVAANTVTEYCEEQCKNKCTPCLELVKTCKINQTDCGLGKPDPVFKGACDPHHVCVEPEFHCKEIMTY